MDGPAGDVDELLARHDALENVDPERGRGVADVPGRRVVGERERYPVFEIDVAGAGEESDAVADAEGEVAVAAREICFSEGKRKDTLCNYADVEERNRNWRKW